MLLDLRSQGLVTAIGAGMNQWEMELQFARTGHCDCFLLAGRYTLLDQSALPEFLPYCVEHHISVVAGGPYNSGILAVGPAGRDVQLSRCFGRHDGQSPRISASVSAMRCL